MTKAEFKLELVADLEYQANKKGRPWTSEHWYLSQKLYPLTQSLKLQAINELISKGVIERASSSRVYPKTSFPMLYLL